MRYCLHSVLLGLSALLFGCATHPAPPLAVKDPSLAMVYGHVEAGDDLIERVDLQQYGKTYIAPFRSPPRVLVFDDGTFVAENLKPGKYIITGFRSDENRYDLVRDERTSYQHIIHVAPGSLKYAGSYRLRVTRSSPIGRNDFKVTQLQRPGERDVLKHLYRITEGTAWRDKVARRLKQLRQ
jgi:hypothetical protein